MAHQLAQKSHQVAIRILLYQVGITAIVALLFLAQSGLAAISALVGGLTSIIPNGALVLVSHRHGGAQSAKKIMSSFYLGEVLKMLLTATMFAVAFILLPVKILPLLVTYILCLSAFFMAGMINQENK